jgi:lipopolysaccharide transport system ATP-binding protein
MISDLPSQIAEEPRAPEAEIAISVRRASKMYRIYDRPQDRLKQMLWRGRRAYGREFWALRDVSFEVRKGETVGIIGRNGSGKSTLLQIIAGTLAPTSGEVRVNGRVAALLELGSGFNPEFTGRENVFLNGAILGIARAEMEQRYAEIAAFADIGEFIEQPVKFYSSGMVVRLAFAVQALIEPDILIVDEALSVGDMYFQTKCMAKIADLRRRGTSILFVSHSLGTIKILCSWAALLEEGRLLMTGHPDPVGDKYVSLVMRDRYGPATQPTPQLATDEHASLLQPPFSRRIGERFGTGAAQYVECQVFQDGYEVVAVEHGKICEIHALLAYNQAVDDWGEVGIVVRTLDGVDLFASNSFLLRQTYPPQLQGTLVEIVFRFQVTIAPGVYSVALGYRAPVQGEYVDKVFQGVTFRVDPRDDTPIPFMFVVPSEFEYRIVDGGSSQ